MTELELEEVKDLNRRKTGKDETREKHARAVCTEKLREKLGKMQRETTEA